MNCRPFKIFNSTELSHIQERANFIVTGWAVKWLNNPEVLDIEIFASEDVAVFFETNSSEWLIGKYANQTFALSWSDGLLSEIYANIASQNWPESKNHVQLTHLSRKLVNFTICTLAEELCKTFYKIQDSISSSYLQSEVFLKDASRQGSGYTIIKLNCSATSHLFIAMDLCELNILETAQISENQKGMQSAIHAIGNHTVKIECIIGRSIIDFQSLENMSVGDVLTIDAKDDSSVDLLIDKKKFCSGMLGKKDNSYAVKIDNYS